MPIAQNRAPDPRTTVVAHLPSCLMKALRGQVPAVVWQAITKQLRNGPQLALIGPEHQERLRLRTVDQLIERINRRWQRSYSDGSWRNIEAWWVAYDLVKPVECTNPLCEDGWAIDSLPEAPKRCPKHRPKPSGETTGDVEPLPMVTVPRVDPVTARERTERGAAAAHAALRASKTRALEARSRGLPAYQPGSG